MHQRARKLLEDIREAIGAIEQFTSGKTFDGYSVLDDQIVWETAQDDLPVLKDKLVALLN